MTISPRYFVNMFIDVTVGLLILYLLISLSRFLLKDHSYSWLKSGEYGNPPQVRLASTARKYSVACYTKHKEILCSMLYKTQGNIM